ncbi:hypothetical protein FLK61_23755 [Paenalkalicoccus suaedae]|uniref:Uncharacterized protein n=1 Tax=Paenalkalicoccus suaedae TaxID=2592382 RepID=A0A859F9M5_9BACI|nr:hypothetical protein [Paenalkalicoccus suaedae]QKS69809.1 hypothetical protein FLK61_23755 [Paenalkalicoccus suaedae]
MRKYLLIFLLAVVVVALIFARSEEDMESYEVLAMVDDAYTDDAGRIRAYGDDADTTYLSETVGLYLEFLAREGEEERFREQVMVLERDFIRTTADGAFILWELGAANQVNALIDDVRIVEALEAGAIAFEEPRFQELADELRQSVQGTMVEDGMVYDFYDWELGLRSQTFHLKYGVSSYTEGWGLADQTSIYEEATSTPFFDEVYEEERGVYPAGDVVHLVDQLLIAMEAERLGVSSEFSTWLLQEWREGMIYGQYDRETRQPVVNHESAAVYGLASRYMSQLGEATIAHDMHIRAVELVEATSPEDVHFFDLIFSVKSE